MVILYDLFTQTWDSGLIVEAVLDVWRIHMPLMNVVIALIVVGVLLWLVNTYIPMDAKINRILNTVVVIAVVIWLLQAFGLLGALNGIRIGH
jgi:undecaprenyl pyrophosphate phosphatase UppP